MPYPSPAYPPSGAYVPAPYGYALVPVVAPAPPIRPATVTLAVLSFASAGLLGLVGAVTFINSSWWDQLLDQVMQRQSFSSAPGGGSLRSVVSFVKTFIVGLGIVTLGLYCLFAWKMWIGRNWARVTITVIAAMATLSAANTGNTYTNIAAGYRAGAGTTITPPSLPPALQVLAWVNAALALAAIVLMFLRTSNRYFADSKMHRRYVRR
ncbi:hypothetical protein SAMN04515671_1819 [Nakamurella panacisegetis]|uniref:Uncharacterized protein n=1 Tax=Nakamurella panacisegetis TaxID=1090615 RepID=A0A1H0LVZ1_9ACTN|nr:hypothetical protein [Nakamurella panacisegetis]SDO72116.1 hypothetical protein SAMN04515671_1819 [Nakamurella panacisegetis]